MLRRRACVSTRFSLPLSSLSTQAHLDSMAEVLRRCGDKLTHIVLASGHDVPLRLLTPGTLPRGVTLYGSYDYEPDVRLNMRQALFRCAGGRHWRALLERGGRERGVQGGVAPMAGGRDDGCRRATAPTSCVSCVWGGVAPVVRLKCCALPLVREALVLIAAGAVPSCLVRRAACSLGMTNAVSARWAMALTCHHQWLVVSVEHAHALVGMREQILEVGAGSRGGGRGSGVPGHGRSRVCAGAIRGRVVRAGGS